MTNSFTLDDLRAEVEKKYAPLQITLSDGTVVTLRHLLRLKDKVREQVVDTLKLLESTDGEDQDAAEMIDAATTVLKLVADQGTKLIRELDGDVTLIMAVLERWAESTQPGEATPSDN